MNYDSEAQDRKRVPWNLGVKVDPKKRFMQLVDKQLGKYGCWLWAGHSDERSRKRGLPYGRFSPEKGINVPAHRFSYEAFIGPIPDGMYVDHLCHRTTCVRPDHLRLVSRNGNSQNRVPTSSRSSFGLRNINLAESAKARRVSGQVFLKVKVHADGVSHYFPRRFLLLELPHAEQIARHMRSKYQPDSDDNEFAAAVALQRDSDEPVLEALRQSLKAVHDLYTSPMVRTTPTAAECERLLVRYRKEPLSSVRCGPMEPTNDFHPERDPLCIYYEEPEGPTTESGFWQQVSKATVYGNCWLWSGHCRYRSGSEPHGFARNGFGCLTPVEEVFFSLIQHRKDCLFYERSCGNPLCVNPRHLVVVKTGGRPRR